MTIIERSKTLSSTSYFLHAWCVHIAHTLFFLLHKSNTDETRKPAQFTNYCSWSVIQER